MTHACPLENWTSHIAQKHIKKMKHRNKKCLCPLNCYRYSWEGTGIHSIKVTYGSAINIDFLAHISCIQAFRLVGVRVCASPTFWYFPAIGSSIESYQWGIKFQNELKAEYPLYLELCPEFAKIRSLYFTHFLLLTVS